MSTDTERIGVVDPPGVGDTGPDQTAGSGGDMATTAYEATSPASEEPPTSGGGRNWKLVGQVALLIAMLIGCVVLVFLLIGENREEPAPAPTIADTAAVRDAAYKASEPVVRDVFTTSGGLSTIPSDGISGGLRTRLETEVSEGKALGITTKGSDTLISVTLKSFEPKSDNTLRMDRVGMTACYTVGRQSLDKDGKNVRVYPDGTPAPPGSRMSSTYYLAPTADGQWLVDQIEVGGPC